MGQVPQNPSQSQLRGFQQITADTQNNIYFIKNDKTKEERVIRKWFYQEEKEYTKVMQALKERQAYSNRYLAKLLKHDLIVHDNICKDNYEIYAVWEHYPITLREEINQRVNQKVKFSEGQIWRLASNTIEALETMQKNKNIHQKLTTQSIRLNNEGEAIVTDPLLLPTSQNYLLVKRNIQNNNIYLSPEEVSSLQMQTLCIKSNKNDVWALGLIFLEAGLLENQSQCYNEQCRKINWVKISQNLKRLGLSYGEKIKKLVSSMLEHNKSVRPSWSQLLRKVQQQLPKPLSVPRVNQNAYLTTTGQSPEVVAYKSMLSEQTEIYSFSRLNQHKIKNPKISEQKQNIVWNHPPPMPVKFGNNPYKPVVNFVKPQNKHIPTYVPIERTPNLQISPIVTSSQVSTFRSPFSPINHQPSEMKKFISPSSSRGFLFDQIKSNQVKIVVPVLQKPKIQEKKSQNIVSNHKFDKQYIKNTESITYQGDFRPVFRQQTHQSEKSGKITEKQQYAVGMENKQIEEQILPLNSQSTEKEVDQIEYVIESFQIGSKYEGQKLKNMRHGEGRFYYQDGGMYDGHWQYNKMHGKGALAYDGMWNDDQFEGKGKLYNQTPETLISTYDYNDFNNVDQFWQYYQGDFVNDMKQGRGKLMLSNGQYYMGNFNQDMIEGNGKFVGKKQVVKGQWEANKLILIASRTPI